jgi:F0F1-type ATP synthase epsilon subunit
MNIFKGKIKSVVIRTTLGEFNIFAFQFTQD